MRSHVEAQGLLPTYEVATQSRTTIMDFSVRGPDADQAVATAYHVVELAVRELDDRQTAAGLSTAAQYGLDMLAEPAVVAVAYDGKLQVQAVTGLLGASLALVVAVLFDDLVGLYRRWRARRGSARADAGETPPVDDPRGEDRPGQAPAWVEGEDQTSPEERERHLRGRDRDPAHA